MPTMLDEVLGPSYRLDNAGVAHIASFASVGTWRALCDLHAGDERQARHDEEAPFPTCFECIEWASYLDWFERTYPTPRE